MPQPQPSDHIVSLTSRPQKKVAVRLLATNAGFPDIVFEWPTNLVAHELLEQCLPYRTGRFRSTVEVIVYPNNRARRVQRLAYPTYMESGSVVDATASAVRFNADAHDGFSVLWVARTDRGVKGEIRAVFGRTPDIAKDMIDGSVATAYRTYINRLISAGVELQASP